MAEKIKEFHFWIPLFLLGINIVFLAFMIEELIDASPPNYGSLGFLMPIIGLISFLYIRKFKGKKFAGLKRGLQVLNWLFIIFPVIILCIFILAFI
ncbi:hypothetical protein [Sporosarcina pasteurii]|uniref:Uncharacterized protein n=1 Tax=Sporosarcina pasteurii TaxID=1474 RepID=A0A380BMK3_SPOPA|nr:hypothetical protein [Sporosarcina pasteurii]MDS9470927.1 hypothetical protein [Sporosarcina pasteurii]QBQ05417.1 hypothetical protein E2C16_06920 [Sporosarcina pasteurii]SUJ03303.1 Uncharacterised protein [Sporosarcina pasteurii]